MSDSSVQQQIATANEPRKWIAAIIGGVVLGEALWSMLQILVRDWATPALQNALGQAPTHNQAAFEPLPLVIAFVEACLAAILLVLLMSMAQRRVRVVVRTVPASSVATQPAMTAISAPQVPVPPAPAPLPTASTRVAPATPPIASIPQTQRPVAGAAAANVAPVSIPATAAPIASTPIPRPPQPQGAQVSPQPVPAPPASPQPPIAAPSQPKPAAAKPVPAPPKKPKVVYYNSVGEPIEE